jgi:hypothetical protein
MSIYKLNLPGISNNNGSWENSNSLDTIEERIEFHEISKEFYLDDNSINKVKIKFPNKEFNFEIEEEEDDDDQVICLRHL